LILIQQKNEYHGASALIPGTDDAKSLTGKHLALLLVLKVLCLKTELATASSTGLQ
jgi:hypothetical protein